jgi:DNA-binding NarL/FixJ family response regulator
LRVAIAEDHYLVREGTRRALEDTGEVEVVAAVGTAAELEDAVARLLPDVVVTDIRMPPDHQTEGINAAHRIRSAHPDVGVVVLSQYADATSRWSCCATARRRAPTCSRSAWAIRSSS